MSAIHYFPRYSQKENMVTNNTLLLFSRLYRNSADKFKIFVNMILGDDSIELDTTVRFSQQEKSKESVPDGVIRQDSFKIIIETKLYGQQNIEQVEKHLDSFGNEDKKIFLWINKEPIESEYEEKIVEKLNEFCKNAGSKIYFASTTFKQICKCFDDMILEYDLEMKELIQDYEAFCLESNLIDNVDSKIRVVLTGKTFEQNMTHSLYYAPSDRGYQNSKYLGLYKDKAIRGIGEITCIVDATYKYESDKLIVERTLLGEIGKREEDTIKKVIVESKEKFGYSLEKGHRFFLVGKCYETEYIKPTKGGLMGTIYFDLGDIDGYQKNMTTEEIANLLNGKEWN
mgnify:CR=1 FL=1